MIPYSKFRPTQFDHAGLGCPEQQGWLVAPCSQNRDSGLAEQSNWETQAKVLAATDPDGEDHECHRFGHWGPGWFELVLVRPSSKAAAEAESLECALADYPLLDDSDYSDREYQAQHEAIEQVAYRMTKDDLPEDWVSQCWSWLWENDQAALECVEDCYPSEDSIRDCLEALGFLEVDES